MEHTTSVFVYGTLKPGGRYHEAYCGLFEFQQLEAMVNGRLYDFPKLGYPGAIESERHWIHGYRFTFSDPQETVLEKLDQLEGFKPDRPANLNEYYRKMVSCYDVKGLKTDEAVWCYFMDPSVVKRLEGIPIPSGHWAV